MAARSFLVDVLGTAAPPSSGIRTYQPVTAVQAQAGYTITATSTDILVELTQDLTAPGATFTLPTGVVGAVVSIVRHGGGSFDWSRVGGDSSDVLKGRDEELEYQCITAPSTWARVIRRGGDKRLVYRINQAALLLDGGWEGVDMVFHTTACLVSLPDALGTRFHCRLIQQTAGELVSIQIEPLSGATLLTPQPTTTAGVGDELDVLVVQNSLGTNAVYRVQRRISVLGSLASKSQVTWEDTDIANATANHLAAWDGSGNATTVPNTGGTEAVSRTLPGNTGTQSLLPDVPAVDYTTLTQGAGNLILAKGAVVTPFGGSYHVLPLIPHSNPSFTVSLGAGMQMVSGGSLSLVPSVTNWLAFEYREALDLFLVALASSTVSPVFTGVAKFAGMKGTASTHGVNYPVVAGDSGKLLVATAAITFTFPAVSTLAPDTGDFFACDVYAGAGSVLINGPGATDVTLATGELASVYARNGGSMIVAKGAATVIS